MSVLLQLKNIRKRYGHVTILEDATASFSKNQKIGVIGRNGAGKSTLCKILTGEEEMDGGSISKNAELRLSYLEQHDPYQLEETILEFLMRYTGREEWQCGEVAGKFQLKNELLETKIEALAGGYRTRVKLAAMLLRDPNFLILDEPSNYLDLSTLILLENFLLEFNGGYLIVSHDREFLKRTCDQTLEVENGRLALYPGNIEDYFTFKEEQLAQKLAYNKTIEKKKEQLQEFVDRFKAKASTATRAKSKMKQIAKLKTIEIEHPMDIIRIKIPSIERKAGVALVCEDLAIGYPEKLVADGIRLEIDRGARIAVLGDNGQGKTTLLRTIVGNLPPKSGGYRWGTGLKVVSYAQHVFQQLHPEDDIYKHLRREAADEVTNQDILNMAGSFLFKGDDTKKKVTVLSGGERARLCLAGLLLSKSQVLILDEPTNHLDFETVEALGGALKDFGGTLFFTSHDRTFVNLVATGILDVKGGTVKRYPGTYEDYVYHLECQARGEEEVPSSASAAKQAPGPAASPIKTVSAEEKKRSEEKEERKRVNAEITKLKNEAKKLEGRITHLTSERDELLAEIKRNPFHYSRERNDRMKQLTMQLEKEEARWLELQGALEVFGAGEKSRNSEKT